MAMIQKTSLPVPPMPSTRDLDNLATTTKQFMSLPAMGVTQMVDLVNNMNKSMLSQVQAMMRNIPAPTTIFPVPAPQMTAERIAQPANIGPITAQSINPVKNENGPITV